LILFENIFIINTKALISKAQIKEIRALHMSKFRQMYNKFMAEGDKVCIEFVKKPKYSIDSIYTTNVEHHFLSNPLTRDKTIVIKNDEMAQISALKTHTQVLMILSNEGHADTIQSINKAIYLDGVQDPGNVGTIIRISDWFGIDTVIRSDDSADFYNPKTVQATMGSMVNVDLVSSNIKELLTLNLPIMGTFLEGDPIEHLKWPSKGVLVMGSEGKGISDNVLPHIQTKINIPGADGRIADSLNVSVATGIVCAAWERN
jgi:RNA methyltransferase, TrmH family